ncbi:MAG: polymer-forming cytoskeletal protein [Woeseiaceae bacterium]|nr:polymer-forming cytoskeletal protein [Woeseiaceae bacterium]
MFERVKRGDDTIESPESERTESDKSFGALRSKVTGRSSESAVIGSSIQINGDLRGDEDLRIEGNVSGTVELKNNNLTIGKEGKVKAGVYAKSIAVDGETKGDLYATDRVSVHVNARVQGNIIAPRVSIEEGAHFKGSIEMDPSAVEKALGKTTKSIAETAKTLENKAAPRKTGKDAGASVSPAAKTA